MRPNPYPDLSDADWRAICRAAAAAAATAPPPTPDQTESLRVLLNPGTAPAPATRRAA